MVRDGFGFYRLLQPIGHGAAGIVYAAEYGRLGHPVAIKLLHKQLVGDGSARRLLDEARSLSMIDHPGIVKVFDVGVSNDGRAYVVMEYLAGESLSARLARAPLSEERVVTFARQLASALDAAHAAGIVHRDLKPDNVFIVPDPDIPGGERIKVIDFGIAKRRGVERTATGMVLGTPGFMAPEQFVATRDVDPRADIYSLGVVMYVMATRKAPFSGADTEELQAEHAYCAPEPVAAVSGMSWQLSAVIDRCLAKLPGDRFASMTELSVALLELELAAPDPFDDDDATRVWRERERDEPTRKAVSARDLGAEPISRLLALPRLEAKTDTKQRPRRSTWHGQAWPTFAWDVALMMVLAAFAVARLLV